MTETREQTPEERALHAFPLQFGAMATETEELMSGDDVRKRIAVEIRAAVIEAVGDRTEACYPAGAHLVWGVFASGEKSVLAAYYTRADAAKYVDRITTQHASEDGRDYHLSHAEVLGIKAVWVSGILVSKP